MLELSSLEVPGPWLSPSSFCSVSVLSFQPPSATSSRWEGREWEGKAEQRLLGTPKAGRALPGVLGGDGPLLQHPMAVSSRTEFLRARGFPFPNPGKPPIPAVLDK